MAEESLKMIDQFLKVVARTDIFTLLILLGSLGWAGQQIFAKHTGDVKAIYTLHNRDINVIQISRLQMDYAWVCDALEKGTAGVFLTQQKATLETSIQVIATELGIEPTEFCYETP